MPCSIKPAEQLPWRHTWFAERFNHVLLKGTLIAAAIGVIAVTALDWIQPFNAWRASKRTGMRVLALSAIGVPLVISTLKQFSSSHCPWDLQRYGGDSPFVRLLELVPGSVSVVIACLLAMHRARCGSLHWRCFGFGSTTQGGRRRMRAADVWLCRRVDPATPRCALPHPYPLVNVDHGLHR
jgi:membrane-associated PAP2 superfamily phosphatase